MSDKSIHVSTHHVCIYVLVRYTTGGNGLDIRQVLKLRVPADSFQDNDPATRSEGLTFQTSTVRVVNTIIVLLIRVLLIRKPLVTGPGSPNAAERSFCCPTASSLRQLLQQLLFTSTYVCCPKKREIEAITLRSQVCHGRYRPKIDVKKK